MIKLKGREIPKLIVIYYVLALCHMALLTAIKLTGWNSLKNVFFFLVTFFSLSLAAYILHIYFKEESEDEGEKRLKEDFGQIWFILFHLGAFLLFLFF